MSTEATGDGHTNAIGATGADVAVGGMEPAVTVVAEPEAAGPAGADPAEEPGADRAEEPGEPARSDDAPLADDAAALGEAGDEPAADYGDYADDDASGYDDVSEYDGSSEYEGSSEYGEALEYDEGYEESGEYEPEEVPEARRARRWPRVLLAFGFVALAAVVVGGAIAIVGSVTHGFTKPVQVTYTKSALFSLKTGQCFDPKGQSYTLISCDSPHVAEVFGTFTLSGSKWPGDTAVAAAASSGCATRLTGYLNPQLAISLSQSYVYPDSVAWQAGTRTVICEVRATAGDLTGSVRGASATAG